MKTRSNLLRAAIITIIISVLLLIGVLAIWLNINVGQDPIVSNDITMLRKHIDIDIHAKDVTWEIVGWPDPTNTTPLAQLENPSHYALLADFTLGTNEWFEKLDNKSLKVWISLSIVRTWLFKPFKQTLQKHTGSFVDVSNLGNCKAYSTTVEIKENKSIKDGFVCMNDGHMLLYLTLYIHEGLAK